MGYFVAFVVGVPAGALAAARLGWQWVFACLAIGSALVFLVALAGLPEDPGKHTLTRPRLAAVEHFQKPDRLSGIAAAFLTSGGIVGFLTYIGAWLNTVHGVSVERIGLLFMFAGIGAIVASPFSGWLSDHAGKRTVIVFANVILAVLFIVVARTPWGVGLVAAVAVLSIAASARQAPLHALSTEIVSTEIRGEYIAVRNAASQMGIAAIAAVSSFVFDSAGFGGVSLVAAAVTLLIPICCIWLKEPAN
jgi:predicted MFS family arabinose efflux permease